MIIKTDSDLINSYLEDASGYRRGCAEQVVIPESEAEVATFMRQAYADRLPVTIAGGRTGVAAGCIPHSGTILSLEKLQALGPIQAANGENLITVGPAVRLETLKNLADQHHFIYGPDPTERTGTLGGNVATNASGGQCFKYGPTRQHVLGLRVVLANGDLIEIRRGEIIAHGDDLSIPLSNRSGQLTFKRPLLPSIKVDKNAAGFFSQPNMDAIDLLIGMDGTLGIITAVTLRLLPKPNSLFSMVLFTTDVEQANSVATTIRNSVHGRDPIPGIAPASIELMDHHALNLLRPEFTTIPHDAGSALIIEQDYASAEASALENWSDFLANLGIHDHNIWLADSTAEREKIRLFRHALPEAVNTIVRARKFPKVGTDMAVPAQYFTKMLTYYYQGLNELKQDFLIFGHIGECHLHVNVLPKTLAEYDQAKTLYRSFAKQVVAFGGTVSAEHGIGKLKHDFLEIMVGKEGLREMARIKTIFDPALILNRGNIFPESYLSN